ncbi:MAG: YbhB/YbcL family Raf kinase inhibitor-like protein, partial [Sulfitobacter sp.]
MKQKILLTMAALTAIIGTTAVAEMSLTSQDLTSGEQIEAEQYWDNFGCSGKNERPQIDWQGAPEATKSFAVTFYDQDAPTGSGFWHWVMFDIPADVTSISADTIPAGA